MARVIHRAALAAGIVLGVTMASGQDQAREKRIVPEKLPEAMEGAYHGLKVGDLTAVIGDHHDHGSGKPGYTAIRGRSNSERPRGFGRKDANRLNSETPRRTLRVRVQTLRPARELALRVFVQARNRWRPQLDCLRRTIPRSSMDLVTGNGSRRDLRQGTMGVAILR